MKLLALIALPFAVGAAAAAGPPVPAFRHVVVIVFENKEAGSVLGSADAPTFNAMARRYAALTEYYGVAHPSLPNYLALVSGSTQGIRTDCTSCLVSAANLADSLAGVRRTWKVYAEGLPRPGFTGAGAGRYAKKHVPFLYFTDVVSSVNRRNRIVPLTRLRPDLRRGTLPDFALIVPDLCHSMHDCSVGTGDRWLKAVLPPLLSLEDSVVFVVFDEGTSNLHGGGHVPALALGSAVGTGLRFSSTTSHYGLLRTVEDAWNLPRLGRSRTAKPITVIWR